MCGYALTNVVLCGNKWSHTVICGIILIRKEEGDMALPVAATPTLSGKEAAEFITAIHKDVQKPVKPTPTPKLEQAHELIKRHAERQQKRMR